jgi:peptide/nickel transport system substrate-binding protein/microcin C transport system substrate-binding protein
MKRILIRTTTAVLSLAILSSIGIAKVNPNAPQGGTFVYNLMAEPETLKVTSRGTQYQFDMKRWTCTFLVERDSENYNPVPGAAKSWEISKDNLIYTFHLQPNAVFHDGSPVTAEDVKFSSTINTVAEFTIRTLRVSPLIVIYSPGTI